MGYRWSYAYFKETQMTPAEIEAVMILMTKHVVDQVQIGDVILTKTQHVVDNDSQAPKEDDEELLFYSSN